MDPRYKKFKDFALSHVLGEQVNYASTEQQLLQEHAHIPPNVYDQHLQDIQIIEGYEELAGRYRNMQRQCKVELARRGCQHRVYMLQWRESVLSGLITVYNETIDVISRMSQRHQATSPSAFQRTVLTDNLQFREESCKNALQLVHLAVAENNELIQEVRARRKLIHIVPTQAYRAAEHHVASHRNPFTRDTPDLHPRPWAKQWGVAHSFKGGGMGKVYLMLGLDDNYRVCARMVTKDTTYSEFGWNSLSQWRRGLKGTFPLEWLTHAFAAACPDARFVLKVFAGPVLVPAKRIVRMTMEYAPHGDLRSLVYQHTVSGEPVAEAFVWFCLQAFVETGLILQKGALDAPTDGWEEIVHRDLKPDNIFLGAKNDGHFPAWPRPLVADFGLAFMTNAEDKSNPTFWYSSGTRGYLAPEQLSFFDERTDLPVDEIPMLASCNIWGFALILFELMQRRRIDRNTQPDFYKGEEHNYRFTDRTRSYYTPLLCRLIEQCLQYDPDRRPTLEKLHTAVKDRFESNVYLQNADAGTQPPPDASRPVMYKDEVEKYKIGFAYPPPGERSSGSDDEEGAENEDELGLEEEEEGGVELGLGEEFGTEQDRMEEDGPEHGGGAADPGDEDLIMEDDDGGGAEHPIL